MDNPNNSNADPEALRVDWDSYWAGHRHERAERTVYDVGAQFYRRYLIEPLLNSVMAREFHHGAKLLHAGCGGGEVDKRVVSDFVVTAVDISPNALELYKARHPGVKAIISNIFDLSNLGEKYEGIYNLGVMEHFSPAEIIEILKQFRSALEDNGKVVLLWPPVYGLSVIALHIIHFLLNSVLRRQIQLHPLEPTKVSSRAQIESYLKTAGFRLLSMQFGPKDAFTYVVVVAQKDGL